MFPFSNKLASLVFLCNICLVMHLVTVVTLNARFRCWSWERGCVCNDVPFCDWLLMLFMLVLALRCIPHYPCVKSKHRLPGERGERVDICLFRLSLFLSGELRSAINVAEERLCKHSCFFPPFQIIVTGISFPPRPRYLKPITADPFGQNHIFIRIAKPLQSCVCACVFHVHFIVLNVQVCFFLFFFFLPSQSLEIDINIKYVPECLVIYAPDRVLLELLALRNVMHCAVYTMCALMDGSLHFFCTATKLIGWRKAK